MEQSQIDPIIYAKSITDQPHHPVTSRHMWKPSPKQPNHPVKLHLAAGSWASPHEIAWARSEQLKLANTFICSMPWKLCDCLLYGIIVALDNWYSRLEMACVNLILLNPRRAISHLKFSHTLKAWNMALVYNYLKEREHLSLNEFFIFRSFLQ